MHPAYNYTPTGWFWRKAITETEDIEDLRELARALVLEIEIHKRFIREMGEIPPKVITTRAESKWIGRC